MALPASCLPTWVGPIRIVGGFEPAATDSTHGEEHVNPSEFPASPPHLRAVRGDAPSAGSDPSSLLVAVATGDETAFAELYDALSGAVYGLVKRILRDPAQSEEVSQEVLLEVWRTAPRFRPDRGSAKSWILTMAHRRAVDRVRSEQASRERDDRVATGALVPAFDVVSETVANRFEADQVRRALSQLTDLQRQAIELAYYGGLTYREVAQLLDTPLGTIKTRLRDGLIRLRDAIGVDSDEPDEVG